MLIFVYFSIIILSLCRVQYSSTSKCRARPPWYISILCFIHFTETKFYDNNKLLFKLSTLLLVLLLVLKNICGVIKLIGDM